MNLFSSVTILLLTLSLVASLPATPSLNCSDWRNIIDQHASRIFLLGDRDLRIPVNMSEVSDYSCPRLADASSKIKRVIKHCLKPFPETITSLILHGGRKVSRSICSSEKEKEDLILHLSCLKDGGRMNQLHDMMHDLNQKLTSIRDSMPDNRKLDVMCCHMMQSKRNIRQASSSMCSHTSGRWISGLVDIMFKDALDFACYTFQREGNLCAPVLEMYPISESKTQQSASFVMPLIDILTDSAAFLQEHASE